MFSSSIFDFYTPLFTEKTIGLLEQNKYTFEMQSKLNKKQIRFFFEKFYKIKLSQINTYRLARKKASILTSKGYRKQTKRVILTFFTDQMLPTPFYSS